ncbi:MAG: helix-turn-helix domain-containing protein [Burkholderiaceae bacterium]|nr:MAG: helix-turn-helix domain-containing protein [Burkholderiaceae bacterium]
MSRKSAFDSLAPELQTRVIALVRANRHKSLDDIKAVLTASEGITISRSAIHRTLTKLNARDHLVALPAEQTVVTVVDRVSGEVRVVKTAIPAAVIEAMIRSAEPGV